MEGSFVEFQQKFTVENYVGHYSVVVDEDGRKYIKSEEKGPKFGGNLEKKKVFNYTINEENSIALKLANVQIEDDESVVDFCNQYGVFFSSQIIYDEKKDFLMMGLEREMPFKEYDFITKEEFAYHFTVIKSVLTLKEWIDSDDVDIVDVYSAFLFLLLFQWYPVKDEMLKVPKTITGKFQKYVLSFDDDPLDMVEKETILRLFLNSYNQDLQKYYAKGKERDIELLKDILNKGLRIEVLEPEDIEEFVRISDCYDSEGKRRILIDLKGILGKIIENSEKDISYLEYLNDKQWKEYYELVQLFVDENKGYIEKIDKLGFVKFNRSFTLTDEQNILLKKSVKQVLCDTLSENIKNISPILEIDEEGNIVGDWSVKYLYEGIFLELYLMMMTNERIRICANPKCRNFFPASQCRSDKKFCSTRCLNAEMKRRQRRRKKENKK